MLKRHNEFFKSLFRLNDVLCVTLAWWLAYGLRFHTSLFFVGEHYVFRHYVIAWLLILLVWGAVFEVLDLYRPRRLSTYRREIFDLIKGCALALLIFLGIIFLLREIVLSRIVVVLFWFAALMFLNLSRIVVREGLRSLRRRGYNLRHVAIVGTPEQAGRLTQKLRQYRHLGQRIVCLVLVGEGALGDGATGVRIVRSPEELLALVRSGPWGDAERAVDRIERRSKGALSAATTIETLDAERARR